MPKLRCRQIELKKLAQRYEYDSIDLGGIEAGICERGFLTKDDLWNVARWKSPRSAGQVEKNSQFFVEEISGIALSAKDERTRIEVLTLLNGVQWPTASVILHFFHREDYPIIDFRALWTVSMGVPVVGAGLPLSFRISEWWCPWWMWIMISIQTGETWECRKCR